MGDEDLNQALAELSTALVADACLRLGVLLRVAPGGIRPVVAGSRLVGPARPVRHQGSVDDLLAALDGAAPGEVLVVDNGGRTDESCLGDLVALEATAAGVAGIVVWGCHRDTHRLAAIDLPIFSYGACPAGPRRPAGEPFSTGVVRLGMAAVNPGDVVVADDDGALVVAAEDVPGILATATAIARVEQGQADAIAFGRPLREQFRFRDYVALRHHDPGYTFRDHLRRIGGEIEA